MLAGVLSLGVCHGGCQSLGKDPGVRRTINGQSWLKEGVCDPEFRYLKKKRNHFLVGGECHVGDG